MSSLSPCAVRSNLRWLVFLWLPCAVVRLDAAVVVEVGHNFTGSTYGTDSPYNPPDSNGAAGPEAFVELINGRFKVYSKTNGSVLKTMTSGDFWSSTGLTFDGGVILSDPRIVYDPSVQRWFASAIDFLPWDQSSNRFVLAVSAGADPTGSWQGVAFTADPIDGNFADFPTLGVDANGVYLAAFMFKSRSEEEVGQTLVSIPKADLLATTPTANNRTWFGLLASTNYGYVLQPVINFDASAEACSVLAMGDLGYDWAPHSNLVTFAVQNAAGPGPATLSEPTNLCVEPYSVPIKPTQPDGNNSLDDGDARLSATVYQVAGVLYAVHGCGVDDRAALRWYKIRAADQTVLQSGTIADTNLDLFYPSIAANASGTVVIGFNGCSTNTFVSCYAIVGETAGGITTFGAPLLLQSGLASYNRPGSGNISRWGDYSSTCVDPADPNRFWTIQMYPVYSGVWATQITELLTAIPMLAIAPAGANVVLSWPGTAIAFDLETAPTADAASWNVLDQSTATATNGLVYLTVPVTQSAQYFRLHKP
jgi:hypothetical protein